MAMVSPPLSSTGAGALAQSVYIGLRNCSLGKLPRPFSKRLPSSTLFIFAGIFHFAPYYPSGHIWMSLFLMTFVRIISFLPLPLHSSPPCLFCTLQSELFLKTAFWKRDYLLLYIVQQRHSRPSQCFGIFLWTVTGQENRGLLLLKNLQFKFPSLYIDPKQFTSIF